MRKWTPARGAYSALQFSYAVRFPVGSSLTRSGPSSPTRLCTKRDSWPATFDADRSCRLDQATFRRGLHQAIRPPPANIRPGSPAPRAGPGTGEAALFQEAKLIESRARCDIQAAPSVGHHIGRELSHGIGPRAVTGGADEGRCTAAKNIRPAQALGSAAWSGGAFISLKLIAYWPRATATETNRWRR
jgi:hypothetical protein